MSNKAITWTLAIVVFLLLTSFFFYQNNVLDRNNRVETTLDNMYQAIKANDWETADAEFKNFMELWNWGKYVVALNNAEQDYSTMSDAISYLKASIELQEQEGALQYVSQIKVLWKNFRRIVPEP